MKRSLLVLVLLCLALSMIVAPVGAQDRPDLLIWADSTRAPALQGLVEQFSTDYGVTAVVQEIGMGDIRSNLTVAGPAGEGPDILIAAHDWLGELLQNAAIVPVELGDLAEQFSPNALDLFTVDGVVYAMPYAVENLAFFRNSDLVPNAPTTWDEVASISAELVSSGASQYGFVIPNAESYGFFPIMTAFGGYVFGRNANGSYNPGDIGIDSEGTIAAAEWVRALVDGGQLTGDITGDVQLALFEQGDAAMMMTGPWSVNRLNTSGVPYAISDIPAGPAGPARPFIGGQGLMISAFSENQLLAQAFLTEFMATESAMLALYDADPRPPAFLPALAQVTDPTMALFQQAGVNGDSMPSIPEMASVWGSWGNALTFVVNGELTATESYGEAAAQIRELIGEMANAGNIVGLAGTLQTELGCPSDWAPECENSFMFDNGDGTYSLTTTALPAGDYEVKVALAMTWEENYGADGERDGANITFNVPADGTLMVFTYDGASHVLTVGEGSVAVVGTVQALLGCPGDWQPECEASQLTANGDGTYALTTTDLTAGDYEAKVALNDGWGINYGVDGAFNGDNLQFNVPADGTQVVFSFDGTTHMLTITVGS